MFEIFETVVGARTAIPHIDRTITDIDRRLRELPALAPTRHEELKKALRWYGADPERGLVLVHPSAPGRVACGCSAAAETCDTCTSQAIAALCDLRKRLRIHRERQQLLRERQRLLRNKGLLNAIANPPQGW